MRFRVALPLLLLLTAPAAAHPLTDVRFDRTSAVRLADDAVEVIYTLEASPIGLHLDAAKRLSAEDIAALDKTARGYVGTYAKKVAPELTEKLRILVDGVRLALEVKTIDPRPHLPLLGLARLPQISFSKFFLGLNLLQQIGA